MQSKNEEKKIGPDSRELDSIISRVFQFVEHAKITRHVPGKLSLKFFYSAFKVAQDTDIDEIIHYFPGVINYQFKPFSRTLLIEYDQKQLPYDVWQRMGQIRERPELKIELKGHLKALLNQKSING